MTADAWSFPALDLTLTIHPVHLLDADDYALLRLAGGVESGLLPEPGGLLDQAACTIESLGVIAAARAKLREKPEKLNG